MKNKLIRLFACLLALSFSFGAFFASAEQAEELENQIINYKLSESGADGVQALINGAFCENASVSEWYILALAQSDGYDFSEYESALLEYLSQNEVRSASSRLKYALTLAAIGSESEYIEKTPESSIGKQGIMSWVYGLHLINNGVEIKSFTAQTVTETILSLQKSDGGWAVMGASGDVDVTAMTVQALAPSYRANQEVKAAVDRAIDFLSSRQRENGAFTSYGVENPESAAQVIIALAALGRDCREDEHFIKGENDLFDVMLRFRAENGGFSHEEGLAPNDNATVQVLHAVVAYRRLKEGKPPFYEFESMKDTSAEDGESSHPEESKPEDESSRPEESNALSNGGKSGFGGYKLWASIAIIAACAVAVICLIVAKKRKTVNFIIVIAFAVIAIVIVAVTDIKSSEEFYQAAESEKDSVGTVTLSISCESLVGKSEESHIPSDGVILESVELEIEEGDTVFDILMLAAAKYKISVEKTGASGAEYIEGIANVYEFDHGDLSGWTFYVNGEKPSQSCGSYKLSSGDSVEWIYELE
ncbi:MAG: DUF4430 domain-containing protein [Clostridia bacterium]|nr:DUF4430 domain-containing protein [Clostridia bacterium]